MVRLQVKQPSPVYKDTEWESRVQMSGALIAQSFTILCHLNNNIENVFYVCSISVKRFYMHSCEFIHFFLLWSYGCQALHCSEVMQLLVTVSAMNETGLRRTII